LESIDGLVKLESMSHQGLQVDQPARNQPNRFRILVRVSEPVLYVAQSQSNDLHIIIPLFLVRDGLLEL
jgi:hypothetical protein